MEFVTELKKIGLKDKEASVYLACLELGPSPVQVIARKAKVVRATTYVILEALMQMGLVTQYKEGKKTLFAAEPPRQLTRLLEKEREAIDERQEELEDILPELQMYTKSTGGKPSARYFDAIEGLRAMRREMMMYSETGDVWYNFAPSDFMETIFGANENEAYYKQRIAKRIRMKSIFSTKILKVREERLLQSHQDKFTEIRAVSSKIFSSPAGMTIYKDRIAIGSFTGKIGGVIIESPTMADMMRCMFDLAWVAAEEVEKDKKV